ncbi:MAG: acetylglutamate kinase [Acidobacteriota bacterium]|nr:acetylglutamate kinase [Acidobacteriota bacterium]
MKLVLKIGGESGENRRVRRSLARQIAGLRRSGCDVVVVHGGGKKLTRVLADLGIQAEFADGLRVTSSETRDVALMVLAGIVNKQWVADLQAQGQPAIGICGGDAGLMTVRKLLVRSGRRTKTLGYVGRPEKVNPELLEIAFERRMVPVVASMALGPGGEFFNVNADDFAAAIANTIAADRLIYLTESGGVWDANRRQLPHIRVREIEGLIKEGVVRDGMIPKLRSSATVIEGGVGEVDIISASIFGSLQRALENRAHSGTRIVR